MEPDGFEEYRAAKAAYARSWYAKRKSDPIFRAKVNAQARERRKRNPEARHKERAPNRVRMLAKYSNDPVYREAVAAYHKRRKARRRYWIDKYKIAKGCSECGYNTHAAALDLHHLGHLRKDKEVSSMLSSTLKAIIAEIRKCIILCSNCHRVLHYKENKNGV